MVQIGNVEIPIVFSIDENTTADVDEIAPLPSADATVDHVGVQHEASVKMLTISGYLNQEIHSQDFTLAEQESDVKNLRKNSVTDNSINYFDYKGYLMVENVDVTDISDSRIINEVVIETRYFPWPKFYPESEP